MEQLSTVTKIGHSTHVKIKEFHYVWKITNIRHCAKPKGQFLYSPDFDIDEMKWTLGVYPNGSSDSIDNNYMILSIIRKDIVINFPNTIVEISVIRKDGQLVNKGKRLLTKADFSKTSEFFFYYFVDKSRFDDENLVPNGEITILCKMFINQGIESSTNDESTSNGNCSSKCDSKEISSEQRLIVLSDDFEQLFENEHHSDFKLIVGETEFNVHKTILIARSPVFAAMFKHEMRENKENKLEIVDISGQIMKEVLRYIYAAKVNNIQELASELLLAADKYQLQGLIAECEKVLIDGLNTKNIAKTLILIDKCYCAEKLRSSAISFLVVNRKALINLEDFNSVLETLSPTLLGEITKALMSNL